MVTCSQASTDVTRTVQVRLAASTATVRVRRSLVVSQHTKAHPGVTHKVTKPTNTAAAVPFANNATAAPITAPTRPTEAVTSRSPSASSALCRHAVISLARQRTGVPIACFGGLVTVVILAPGVDGEHSVCQL